MTRVTTLVPDTGSAAIPADGGESAPMHTHTERHYPVPPGVAVNDVEQMLYGHAKLMKHFDEEVAKRTHLDPRVFLHGNPRPFDYIARLFGSAPDLINHYTPKTEAEEELLRALWRRHAEQVDETFARIGKLMNQRDIPEAPDAQTK